MRAHVDEQSVINANSQFWEQMLSMTLDPMPSPKGFSAPVGHVMGSVSMHGNWIGRIEVRMTERLAYEATAAMMMQPVGSVVEADALDATKEIANMIAGTIKSSLPRPCSMSVPESEIGAESFSGQTTSEDTLMVMFRHATGDLVVRIHEQECIL
jgi:CheY-specific phosphatase CheX